MLQFTLAYCNIFGEKEVFLMDTKKIGDFLKSLRKAKGLTQEEVANALFLSPKTISRWENGLGIPDINIISSVADLYEVTVDEILKGSRKQAKEDGLSNATIKLKEKATTKLICNSISDKLNRYFIVAIAIEGVFFLIELLVGLLASEVVAVIMMPFGLIPAITVMVIGNKEIKHKYNETDEAIVNGLNEANKEMRRKNVMFADIMFGFILASIILLLVFIA